jgi:hypothetical protein
MGLLMVLLIGSLHGEGLQPEDLLPYFFIFCLWFLPWMASIYMARQRGHDPFIFGLIGFILGLPGLFLTMVATSPPRENQSVRTSLDHFLLAGISLSRDPELVLPGGNPGESASVESLIDGLFKRFLPFFTKARETGALSSFYKGLQAYLLLEDRLILWRSVGLLAFVTLVVMVIIAFMSFNCYLFPMYISFVEGHNLTLPFTIKLLITFHKLMAAPAGHILFWFAWIFSPFIMFGIYRYLIDYRFPLIGKVGFNVDFILFLKALNLAILSGFELPEAYLQAFSLASYKMKAYLSMEKEAVKGGDHGDIAIPGLPIHISSLLKAAQAENNLPTVLSGICNYEENSTAAAISVFTAVVASLVITGAIFCFLYTVISIGISFYQ